MPQGYASEDAPQGRDRAAEAPGPGSAGSGRCAPAATPRDAAARGALPVRGTPAQVADMMQAWFEADACDGFILAFSHLPGGLDDVARLLMPELRRRGLIRTGYAGAILREHLGLRRPSSRYAARG